MEHEPLIPGISAEINKVFGNELAILFSKQISEETMLAYANQAWNDLRKSPYSGVAWGSSKSEFEKLVEREVANRIKDEINRILETEEAKEDISRIAEEIIEEIREKTKEKMVSRASDTLASMFCGYGNQGGIRGVIESVVHDMIMHN